RRYEPPRGGGRAAGARGVGAAAIRDGPRRPGRWTGRPRRIGRRRRAGSAAMTRFPREDYRSLELYDPGRRPVELDLSDNTNRWGAHPEALAVVRAADDETLTRYP